LFYPRSASNVCGLIVAAILPSD